MVCGRAVQKRIEGMRSARCDQTIDERAHLGPLAVSIKERWIAVDGGAGNLAAIGGAQASAEENQ